MTPLSPERLEELAATAEPRAAVFESELADIAMVLTRRGKGLNMDFLSCPHSWLSPRTEHVPELDGEEAPRD